MRRLAGALCAVLAVSGCSSFVERAADAAGDRSRLEDALVLELDGYSAVAGPSITAVCDPSSPSGGTVPELPADLGEPVSQTFQRAESTVEAYLWAADDEEAAQAVVDAVAQRADDCAHEVFTDADTDGDGAFDAGSTDVQTAETWRGAGWTGLLFHREVAGFGSAELVERRLVHQGDVVVLAVLRADRVDVETAPLDELLEKVRDRLG